MQLDIKLNETYDYFDDGKIKESRRMSVTITDIIPFKDIDSETLSLWQEEVKECYWLYTKETDFFIKGKMKLGNDKYEEIVFVRTINNNDGWFSMGFWGGRLDADGSLARLLKDN